MKNATGYRAPSTAQVNQDMPLLRLGSTDASTELLWADLEVAHPLKVVLRARLVPLFLKEGESHASAQLRIQGQSFETQPLYNRDSRCRPSELATYSGCKAVEVHYVGMGTFQLPYSLETLAFQGTQLDELLQLELPQTDGVGTLLYRKPFAYQREGLLKEVRTYLMDGRLFHDPPKRFGIERVLRAHSGLYKSGSLLEDVQQLYVDLSEAAEKTIVNLTRSNDWMQQGLSFQSPKEALQQGICFLDPPKTEEGISLAAALQGGYAKLCLRAGETRINYVATGYQQLVDDPLCVDVFFTPQ